jgi:hypothetical protein
MDEREKVPFCIVPVLAISREGTVNSAEKDRKAGTRSKEMGNTRYFLKLIFCSFFSIVACYRATYNK